MSDNIKENQPSIAEHIIENCAPKYLDGMSTTLITAAIKFIGDNATDDLSVIGDEGFLAIVNKVYKDSSIAHITCLNDAGVVTAFYAEHKDDILEYCAESAYRYGENSAVELVANFIHCDNQALNFDQVAIGLFVPKVGEVDEATVITQRFAIACVLDEVAKAHELTAYDLTTAVTTK